MREVTRTIALVAAGGLMFGGCASLTGRTLGRYLDDKMTTARVKTRLATEDAASVTRVNVDTYNGTVYLNGVVASEAEKHRFEETARQNRNPVVSNLQVRQRGTVAARGRTGESASPGTESDQHAAMARQGMSSSGMMGGMVSGEVTDIDHETGTLSVKTADGTMDLRFPPSAVQHIRPGDQVRVGVTPESRQ